MTRKVRVCFETYGCSLNKADSETMMGILQDDGFELVNTTDNADLIIINTCTVKGPTETKFYRNLSKHTKVGKPIIICGCLAQTNPKKLELYSLVGVEHLTNIADVARRTLAGETVKLVTRTKSKRLNLPKVRHNKVIEIVPISKGCLGNCSYCIVKSIRGQLESYNPDEICRQIACAVKEGVKEIWLTSQDTGCYGLDIGTDLAELLQKIKNIDGDFRIRIGMINPNHLIRFADKIIKAIQQDSRIYQFLHIPLQAGSDEILNKMNRKYTAKQFIKLVAKLRKSLPQITIATDIICGFPTETEKQFNETLKVVKNTELDVINISRYWPREDTEAAKMKLLPGWKTKERSRRLTELFDRISTKKNKDWVGWEGQVLVDELGKNSTMIGRNFAYKPIVIRSKCKIGTFADVKVTSSTKHHLVSN